MGIQPGSRAFRPPHAQSCPAPNAGWPGIQAESHPASSHFPSHSQITPMNIHPIQLLPLLLPPFKPPKCIPLGNIPVFFSQCPKSRQILGIREAFFCSIPKISRLFEFFPEKPQIFGYWRKKTAYMPKLRCQNPNPLPLYPYSVSMRILPLARCRAHIYRWPGDIPVFPRTGQACYSAAANLRRPLVKSPLALPGFLCYSRTGLDPRPGTGARHIYIPSPRLAGIPWGSLRKTRVPGNRPLLPEQNQRNRGIIMKRILSLLKKDAVLTAAWTLAVLSMAAVPPSIRYIGYLDLHTLGLLFCLMVTMAGLQAIGFFHRLGESLLMRIKSLRQLEILLVLLCFFSSMLITNDVALITFVPFAIELLKMIRREDRLIPVVRSADHCPPTLEAWPLPSETRRISTSIPTTIWEWASFSGPCCLCPPVPATHPPCAPAREKPATFFRSVRNADGSGSGTVLPQKTSFLSAHVPSLPGSRRKMDPHPAPSTGGRVHRALRRPHHIFKGRLLSSDHLCGIFHFHREHEADPLAQQPVPAAGHRS